MTENTGSYKKTFADGESKTLEHIMFHYGERKINGVNYTFESFFDSGLFNIREVMCMPVNDRVAYLVWYDKN